MKWQDILKETITQSRVKEIEDIDIDIDEDDCLRWLNKLYDILAKEPSAYWYDNNIEDEETACRIKEVWEDRSGRKFRGRNSEISNNGQVKNRNKKHKVSVVLQVYHFIKNNTFDVELYSSSRFRHNRRFELPREVKWVALEKISEEKAIRKIKELCNYLNISYDKLTEGVF